MDNKSIWKRVEEAMKRQNTTMTALATGAGISRQSLYNLKRNGTAHTKTIKAIAEALGVGAGYLMD